MVGTNDVVVVAVVTVEVVVVEDIDPVELIVGVIGSIDPGVPAGAPDSSTPG